MTLLTASFGLKGDGLQSVLTQELENVLRDQFASTIGAQLINRITAGGLTTSVSADSFTTPGLNQWNTMDTIKLTGKQTYSVDTYTTGANNQMVVFDLLSAWNTIKNINLVSDKSEQLRVNGFVHVDIWVGRTSGYNSTIDVLGAKRGNIVTGAGADFIQVGTITNDGNFSNDFRIGTGDGNDRVGFSGLGTTDATKNIFDLDPTYDLPLDNTGKYTNVYADLGAGNDQFLDTSQAEDKVWGGAGNDQIKTGAGDDWIDGGAGNDHLFGGLGSDRFVFTGDFGFDRIDDPNIKGGRDTLQFDKAVFGSVADVVAAATYDAKTFTTYINVDFDKDGTVDAQVALTKFNIADLGTAFDFIFI